LYEWIIGSITAGAAVGALWFTANSFIRLRKTEQVRLSESILKDIRNSIKDFDLITSGNVKDSEEDQKLKARLLRYLDNACETLNWYCELIDIGEINDKRLGHYIKRIVVKWHDEFFVKEIGVELIGSGKYPSLTKVYQRFEREEDESKVSETKITSKYFNAPRL